MGADLVINTIAKHIDTDLDYEAGKNVAQTMPLFADQLEHLSDLWLGLPYKPEEHDEPYENMIREHMIDQIATLKLGLTEWYARDVATIRFGDHFIFITGGSSWGDSPGPTFQALQDLWEVPDVLQAIGFVWPDALETKVEEEDLPIEKAMT